jgi:hypothetical protein
MSEHFIRFIPLDPRFVPEAKAAATALALLRSAAPDAADVFSETDDHIVFRDCGGNFERIRCPGCGAEIAIAMWQEWMDADYDGSSFRLEPLTTPCCGTRETLNGLVYDWPLGFSRYALSARDPGGALRSSLVDELEEALGCRLRTIRERL